MYKEIPSLKFWCNKILPLVYDDSLSYYELLCKVVERINEMIANQDIFNSALEGYGVTITQLVSDTEELRTELERVKNGDYVSLYIDSITKWFEDNIVQLVADNIKLIHFELENDRIVAYSPISWDILKFSTEYDKNSKDYGHLILEY